MDIKELIELEYGKAAKGEITPEHALNNIRNFALSLQQEKEGKEGRALSSITDDDYIGVAKILFPASENWSAKQHNVENGKCFVRSLNHEEDLEIFGLNYPGQKVVAVIDFLRSRGYHIPNAYATPPLHIDWEKVMSGINQDVIDMKVSLIRAVDNAGYGLAQKYVGLIEGIERTENTIKDHLRTLPVAGDGNKIVPGTELLHLYNDSFGHIIDGNYWYAIIGNVTMRTIAIDQNKVDMEGLIESIKKSPHPTN